MLPIDRGDPGSLLSVEKIDAQLGKLAADRPYLYTIRVLDAQGRAIYNSDSAFASLNLSDRPYFQHHRDTLGTGLEFGAPIRSNTVSKWIIPVTRAVRGPGGEFAGVIVAAVDPMYFDRVWALDGKSRTLRVTLFRTERRDADAKPVQRKADRQVIHPRIRLPEAAAGTLRDLPDLSAVDGKMRLFAYRQLTAFPGLVLVTGHAEDQVLRAWWRHRLDRLCGWLVAVLAGRRLGNSG